MNEEFARVKLGDMYVKDFKIITVKDNNNYWRVKREISLINSKEDGIPILKEESQGIMKLLDKSAVLENLESKGE
jgi:hypothetical protein